MMAYLQIAVQIASVLTGFSLIILVIQLTKDMKGQNLQALFYLHQYLAKDEFSFARYKIRKELCNKPHTEWNSDDKNYANKVCSSYDQAGLLISFGIMNQKTKKIFLKSSWGISICEQYKMLDSYLSALQTPYKTGHEFFFHFSELYEQASKFQIVTKCNQ